MLALNPFIFLIGQKSLLTQVIYVKLRLNHISFVTAFRYSQYYFFFIIRSIFVIHDRIGM